MLAFRGLTASLLLDITYLTSVHEDGVSKLSARRHEKKHRGAAASAEPPSGEGKAEGEGQEQKESAAATSDLRVSHSLDEVKAHARAESEICSVASGGASEGVFTSTPAEGSRRKGHEHGCRGHEPPPVAGPSEVQAVQLSYLYLGAMKALSTLLSCSKYAELLLIPKVPQQVPGPVLSGLGTRPVGLR